MLQTAGKILLFNRWLYIAQYTFATLRNRPNSPFSRQLPAQDFLHFFQFHTAANKCVNGGEMVFRPSVDADVGLGKQ